MPYAQTSTEKQRVAPTSARKGTALREPPAAPDDLALGHWLRRAHHAVVQDFNRVFARHDLRPTEIALILLLQRRPGLKQCDAAEVLGVQRANFVSLVDNLEGRDILERRKPESDRRVQALYLTPEGLSYSEEIRAVHEGMERRLVENLGGREAQQMLVALLERLSA